MKIQSIDNAYNNNFTARHKPLKKVNNTTINNTINELAGPLLMGSLVAQAFYERAQKFQPKNDYNKGYLNEYIPKETLRRGQRLASIFDYYRNQSLALYNIAMIISDQNSLLNDHMFIQTIFDFIKEDLPEEAKCSAFNSLAESSNSHFVETIALNFITPSENLDDVETRFNIPEILELEKNYNQSSNKELILDMIKEGITVNEYGLKIYRFKPEDILNLSNCFENTLNKELFLTLISQYKFNSKVNEYTPLYNSSMILSLINNCLTKEKEDFLIQIASEKIKINGETENRFSNDSILIFSSIYDKYPEELKLFVNQLSQDKNGKQVPKFNKDEIIYLIKSYEILGNTVINLAQDNKLDFKSIKYINEKIFANQANKTNNKKLLS